MHFTAEEFKDVEFEKGDILEFGSVALKTAEAKGAHLALIEKAKKAGATVCFDPNLRFNLWDSASELKDSVNEFLPYADVVKVGADELEFLTGGSIEAMFAGGLKILLVTDGGKGAKLYLADGREFACNGYKVKAVDTTGAGDSFFGGFIAQLMEGKTSYQEMLEFACKCGAYTTTGYGAIPAMGNKEKIERAVK